MASRFWQVSLPLHQPSISTPRSALHRSVNRLAFDIPSCTLRIPELRAGNLDSLLTLSDDLSKVRVVEYSNMRSDVAAINREQTASMEVRDLSKPSGPEDVISSEHLTNVPVRALALGLMAGMLLFPQESSAVDMEAVTSQGLMGWAANEPANALSLPTWVIHVASVVEWVVAMGLVWKYGDTPGKSAWKGLTWGMVPLLGGAMCACTWHFFYNDPSLEGLVVLQAFLTCVGNCTMWAAAYRIWKISQEKAVVK